MQKTSALHCCFTSLYLGPDPIQRFDGQVKAMPQTGPSGEQPKSASQPAPSRGAFGGARKAPGPVGLQMFCGPRVRRARDRREGHRHKAQAVIWSFSH